jgi:hypothetical protein
LTMDDGRLMIDDRSAESRGDDIRTFLAHGDNPDEYKRSRGIGRMTYSSGAPSGRHPIGNGPFTLDHQELRRGVFHEGLVSYARFFPGGGRSVPN